MGLVRSKALKPLRQEPCWALESHMGIPMVPQCKTLYKQRDGALILREVTLTRLWRRIGMERKCVRSGRQTKISTIIQMGEPSGPVLYKNTTQTKGRRLNPMGSDPYTPMVAQQNGAEVRAVRKTHQNFDANTPTEPSGPVGAQGCEWTNLQPPRFTFIRDFWIVAACVKLPQSSSGRVLRPGGGSAGR